MSDENRCELWQYKTTTFDRSNGTVFWDEAARWIKLDELGGTEWELCQLNGQTEYDTAWAIFRRRVTQGECKDKPAGPFSVYENPSGKRFLRYDAGDGERFSKMLPVAPSYLAYLVKWINELLAEREAGR